MSIVYRGPSGAAGRPAERVGTKSAGVQITDEAYSLAARLEPPVQLLHVRLANPGARTITSDMVRAHHAERVKEIAAYTIVVNEPAVASTVAGRPSLVVTRDSITSQMQGRRIQVRIDLFAGNPLADDLKQSDADHYSKAVANLGAPPSVFRAGDLPVYIASGLQPDALYRLPYFLRPYASSLKYDDFARLVDRFDTTDERTREHTCERAWAAMATEFEGALGPVNAYQRRLMDWLWAGQDSVFGSETYPRRVMTADDDA